MTSLTPAERNAEATNVAMTEGLTNGLMTLIPSTGAVYLAMKNSPRFLARTNMQSRTALAIMPALFVFAWTAVSHLCCSCVLVWAADSPLCRRRRNIISSSNTPTVESGRKTDAQDEGNC